MKKNVFIYLIRVHVTHRYVISYLLDSTLGLLLIYVLLKVFDLLVRYNRCYSLRNGEYGRYFLNVSPTYLPREDRYLDRYIHEFYLPTLDLTVGIGR